MRYTRGILMLALGACASPPPPPPEAPPKPDYVEVKVFAAGRELSVRTRRGEYQHHRQLATTEVFDVQSGERLLGPEYGKFPDAVAVVPGLGIFTLEGQSRWAHFFNGLDYTGGAFEHGLGPRALLSGHRLKPAQQGNGLPSWKSFDPTTKTRTDSDVVWIEALGAPGPVRAPEGWIEPIPDRVYPTMVVRVKPAEKVKDWDRGRLDAEFYSPAGRLMGRYERFDFHATTPVSWFGDFRWIRVYTDTDDTRDLLLGPDFQFVSAAPGPILWVNRKFLAVRAPGTPPEDDLWVFLQPDGRFGAPPGIVGFRPVYRHWTPDVPFSGTADSWLVRYQDPKSWGKADASLVELSGPLWDVAELHLPPTHKRPYEFPGIPSELRFNDRDGVVDFALLVTGAEGRWEARSTAKPDLKAEGTSMNEVLARVSERCEALFLEGQRATQEYMKVYVPWKAKKDADARLEREQELLSRLKWRRERAEWESRFYGNAPEEARRVEGEIARLKAAEAAVSTSIHAQTAEAAWLGAGTPSAKESVLSLYPSHPFATQDAWYEVAKSSDSVKFLAQAVFRVLKDPGRKREIYERFWNVAKAKGAGSAELHKLLRLSREHGLLDPTTEAEIQAQVKQAELREANRARAERERVDREYQERLEAEASTSAPAVTQTDIRHAQVVQRAEEQRRLNDYRRGLEQAVRGKRWTPYGY
jgi:hypothetical protein